MDAKTIRTPAAALFSDTLLPGAKYVLNRFREDGCNRSSAALTYMSLFALVPLITVMFAILSAIPDLQARAADLQDLLFDNLFPDGASSGDAISNAKAQVSEALVNFSQQAQNLSGPGVGVLIVTAVLMLRNVEATFNTIWRTRRNRSPVSSFLLYWAVLSLGPILIGLALGSGAYLAVADNFVAEFDVIGIRRLFFTLAPLLLSAAAFSLLYAAVPNCRVNMRHALIGGLVTALVFNVARWAFGKLIAKTSYTAIYGAFAAFPLLLLWIFLSWNIVLAGAVLVHSLSTFRYESASRVPALLKALVVLELLWERYQAGEPISEFYLVQEANRREANLDNDTWVRLRDKLFEHNLVVIDERGRYLLARDLNRVPFWQLKEWVTGELALEQMQMLDGEGWRGHAQELIQAQRQHQREHLSISLAELFSR
ncbi:MAG: YihY family inner membrane protein [Halieaceae bacterium]|jgi:membrane protein|nr:YihY family inner membrane protein [Halieaceae bacterium]